jgi:lauroyl/myristoyl acyltransferase
MVDAILLGLFNFTRFLARFLPPAVMCAFADGLGYALYYVRGGGRGSLLSTLRESLPDIKDERELRRIAKKAYGAHFRTILDFILLERYKKEILERIIIDERVMEKRDQAKAAGCCVAFAPHLGAVGIEHALFALLGKPYTPMAMPPDGTPIPRYCTAIIESAERVGSDPDDPVIWAGKDTINEVHRVLAKGGTIGMTYDLPGGTVREVFGKPTAIASGIAHFICDSGAPVVAAFFKRKGPLNYEMIGYDFEYALTGDRAQDVTTILDQVIQLGEEMIREAPEQWIGWFGLNNWRKSAEKIIEQKSKAQSQKFAAGEKHEKAPHKRSIDKQARSRDQLKNP